MREHLPDRRHAAVFQSLGRLIPVTYDIRILRGIALRGAAPASPNSGRTPRSSP
jgi:hypothetical protein